MAKLKNHYAPTPSRIARRHAFHQRKQAEGETVNQFKSAALHCEFKELDDALLDRLVCGLKDLRIQCRLLAKPDLMLQSALDKACAAELSNKSTLSIGRKTLAAHQEEASEEDVNLPGDDVIHRLKTVPVKIEGQMEVDTGASLSLVSWSTIKRLVPKMAKIKTLFPHIKRLSREYNSHFQSHKIVERVLPSLLGLDWFESLGLAISGVLATNGQSTDTIDTLAKQFVNMFDNDLGKYTGKPILLNLDPTVMPRRLKARQVSGGCEFVVW
ncbi:hypothetical protein E2320_009745, partial [Naja naja]